MGRSRVVCKRIGENSREYIFIPGGKARNWLRPRRAGLARGRSYRIVRLVYITAGAAVMYCGSCIHDNTLAAALISKGHEVTLLPTYTPSRTDEANVSVNSVFYGAINVYLQEKSSIFRHTPRAFDWLLNRPGLVNWVTRFSSSTSPEDLGALTVSILEGEDGFGRLLRTIHSEDIGRS